MKTLSSLALASLLLVPTGAVACEDDVDEEPVPPVDSATFIAPRFATRVVVREGAWLDSEMDSTWTDLEPGLFLLRLRRPTGAWVAETWFFRLASEPTRAYTFEEMSALEAAGTIDSATACGLISDQVLVYARDEAQAARLARAMRPSAVPPRVAAAIQR